MLEKVRKKPAEAEEKARQDKVDRKAQAGKAKRQKIGDWLEIKVKKTSQSAKMPAMAHEGDSGFDLFASESVKIKPGERALVSTGLKISMPQGIEAQVRPKSGLAIKHGLTVLNTPGTIDSGYRGEIKVILANLGKEDYQVETGKKIAQIVFAKVECPGLVECKELDETKRSEGGFGSTGME